MAIPRLRVPSVQQGGSLREAAGMGSDEVELYHRTYTTLLRSSGETFLRVLEPAHRAMNSSLHPLANTSEPDLGAFMYAVRRLPAGIFKANPIVMGQEAVEFRRHGIGNLEDWDAREAPARRRWWFDDGTGTSVATSERAGRSASAAASMDASKCLCAASGSPENIACVPRHWANRVTSSRSANRCWTISWLVSRPPTRISPWKSSPMLPGFSGLGFQR